ncbi:MAG: phenylalanine--tRNA ligase subunit beta [Anaerolineae bacterium]
MKVPLSWLEDFVDISIPVEVLAERLTLAGLEVAGIRYVGVPAGAGAQSDHLVWDREKLVLGQLLKVEPHPNADRLVLATVDIGAGQPETVVTGAPNLFPYLGQGDIGHLGLKSPFALEGATLYDGYGDGTQLMTLKGRKIRGIMNRHMLCSEKELGISDEHEGIILMESEFAPGTPLVDVLGDVVLDLDLTPNLARLHSIIGVAREVAALLEPPVRVCYPDYAAIDDSGPPLAGRLIIETENPDLNPRFCAMLIEGVEIKPSPYWMQYRLRLAGMRPISNVVDVSNYVMLELGQPNHAFDWDILRRHAGPGVPVRIITRLARPGETLETLDGLTHRLPDFTILVTDPQEALSIGGVMGGARSEVHEKSTSILLEAAAWNFINIRRTMRHLNISSEAGYRFSRGVHPSQAELGALRATQLIQQVAGGTIAQGLFDYYPNPPRTVVVDLPLSEVSRLLGIELSLEQVKSILESLEFECEVLAIDGQAGLRVTVPDHRTDIGEGVIGRADLIEEVARIYGYDRIPVSEMADELPPQRNNDSLDWEERTRDLLVQAGLQEVITYRLTTPEAEDRLLAPIRRAGLAEVPPDDRPYVTLANYISADRVAMRHSLLNSVLEIAAGNSRHHERVRLFEVGHIYLPDEDETLPLENRRLALVLTGPRDVPFWQGDEAQPMDFFDLKGIIEALIDGLHIADASYEADEHPSYHPGRLARLVLEGQGAGLFGELHPLVARTYDLPEGQPVLAADLDLDALLTHVPDTYRVASVPRFPAVQQDIAVVVDEGVPAARVQALIERSGQPLLAGARLFDVYRGQQIGPGKKSLAYSLTFQAEDRTLTDKVVAKQQQRIVQRLERELGAKLRS